MRKTALAALIAVLWAGATLAAPAENIPLPQPSPKRQQAAPQAVPRPPVPITPSAATPPGQATALDDNQRAVVNKISKYLSSVQTLVGDFVQVGPDGRRTEGQFYIQKPGKVRFATIRRARSTSSPTASRWWCATATSPPRISTRCRRRR